MYHGFDLFQERVFRSDWHQEREKASIDFRRVVEDQPRDVRMVVAAFSKIEKVTNCVSLISDPCIECFRQQFTNTRVPDLELTFHAH